MMEITFIDETNSVSQDKITDIDSLLQFSANYLKLSADTEISFTFMDNGAIQEINRT